MLYLISFSSYKNIKDHYWFIYDSFTLSMQIMSKDIIIHQELKYSDKWVMLFFPRKILIKMSDLESI